jgi:hypothetical protein
MRNDTPAPIKIGYPVTVRELRYQLKLAIWKAGRGPFPDDSQLEVN